jgi:hypothetical protein
VGSVACVRAAASPNEVRRIQRSKYTHPLKDLRNRYCDTRCASTTAHMVARFGRRTAYLL